MEISELVRELLEKRGVREEHAIAEFLEPDYELHTHDPFLLQGMEKAVERVLAAMAKGERVAIYADFDCDGVPGAAVLHDMFKKVGYEHVEAYFPHRDTEGYGFHEEAIRALAARGVTLIITVDVGTKAVGAVRFAKELGVDVIVTDHHVVEGPPAGGLPPAVAVLNPRLPPYPFPHLCGAAVAFKLAQALLTRGRERGAAGFASVGTGWEKWLLDLVAIATVADLVPLIGENRVLAQYGLRVLRKSPRLGIAALCERARLRRAELTEDDIAFSIAPRINAASRMDDARVAFELLTTRDAAEAAACASRLEDLNTARKGVVAGIVRQAKKRVRERFAPHEKVVVLGDTQWKPALLGPAANSILGSRRLPDGSQGLVCLWGRSGNGALKGSCRSDGSVSVAEVFARAGESLVEYGGHERSGGFTVSQERVHTLPAALASAQAGLAAAPNVVEEQRIDRMLALSELSRTLFDDVSRLAPFGVGNPKPVFLFSEVVVTEVRRFGKEGNHTEVLLECRRTGTSARAFDFFASPEQFSLPPAAGVSARICATIERDAYRGGLALRLVDVIAA